MKRFLILLAVVAAGWLIAQNSDGFGPEELAVTAPVVASGAWSPTNETVLAWWDATTISQSDNTSIDPWTARSGPALQGFISTPPSFQTNEKNGLPIVRYPLGANLSCTNQVNNLKPVTFAVVIYTTTTSGTILGGTATGGISLDMSGGLFRVLKQGVAGVGTCPATISTWYALVFTYDASGNFAFYTNGVAGTSGTADQTFTGGQLRTGVNASLGEQLSADLGDIIIDDAVWSSTTIANFFAWANTKWALGY